MEGTSSDNNEGQKNSDNDGVNELIVSLEEQEEEVVLLRSSTSEPTLKDIDGEEEDDDDDDCLVLECDPEHTVTAEEDVPSGSDELVVVGQKGQVACRDYPHPRHLCANFPFSSTPHVKHCEQCHCYVCDSIAPCLKWGTGISITDHCHATDKSKMWKTQRTNFKLGKTAPIPASTSFGTSCNVGNPIHNHNMSLDVMRFSLSSLLPNAFSSSTSGTRSSNLNPQNCASVNLRPLNQVSQPNTMSTSTSINSRLWNQVSRPVSTSLCSTSNFTTPHIANGYNESVPSLARNQYQSLPALRQLLGVQKHAIQKKRARGSVNLGPQFLEPCMMMSNRVGRGGSTLLSNYPYHSSLGLNNNNHVISAQQYNRYHHPATGFSGIGTIYQQSDIRVPNIVPCPQQRSGLAALNCVNSNITAYDSQALYQSNGSQNFYGCHIQGNHAPSSYAASLNTNQHSNMHRIGTQHENAQGVIRNSACQQKRHNASLIESALREDFSAFDSSWAEIARQNQNISHVQPIIKESGTQFSNSTNTSLVDDIKKFLFDEDGSIPPVSDVNIESYLFDDDMFLTDFDNLES